MERTYDDIFGMPYEEIRERFERAVDSLNNPARFRDTGERFDMKKVIVNRPATIILWDDGTKTVTKCMDGDAFDIEKGIMICILKKMLRMSNTDFKKLMKQIIEGADIVGEKK